jgi:hypothetical protein
MNLVDAIKGQLAGEVTKKLGGMAGLNDSDMTKAIGAGLPGLLSGLGSLASTKQGAGKIADAIGGMDSSMFGNLAGMLGGNMMSKGGGLLSGLLGGTVVDGLATTISKFTGISASMIKPVLGYLAPLVLGSVGSSLKGGRIDADGISRLFSEQKQNISASLPAGLNLDSIPGFQALSSAGASRPAPVQASNSSSGGGLGSLLLPLILLAAVVGGVLFFMNRGGQEVKDTVGSMQNAAGQAAANAQGAVEGVKDALADAASKVPGLNLDAIKNDLGGMMDQLGGSLGKITDVASAEEALPGLKESIGKLDIFANTVGNMPAEGKSIVGELTKGQMEKLNPIIEKIGGIPGLGDTIKQLLEQLKGILAKLIG